MKSRQNTKSILSLVLLWLGACGFLVVFSISTSPLSSHFWGSDSGFFQAVGKAAGKGAVMYRDVFDTKGPYLFFLQTLGYRFLGGRFGVFAIQCVHVFFDMLFLWLSLGIAVPEGKKLHRVLPVFCFFALWAFTLDCGNLTEEYAMPFLCMGGYLFLRFLKTGKIRWEGLWIGLGFGYVLMGRASNTMFLCVIVFVMIVVLLTEKRFADLGRCAGLFLLGFLLAVGPFCVYYRHTGTFEDMIYQVFLFGYLYAVEGGIAQGFLSLRWGVIVPFVLLSAVGMAACRKSPVRLLFLAVDLAAMVALMCLGNAYIHYYQLLIPSITLVLILISENGEKALYDRCIVVFGALLVCCNPMTLAQHCGRITVAVLLNQEGSQDTALGKLALKIEQLDPYGIGTYGYSNEQQIRQMLDYIPEEEYDQVLTYDVRPYFYLLTDVKPYCRYWITLDHFSRLSDDVRQELVEKLAENPPKYILTGTRGTITNPDIRRRLLEEYDLTDENTNYRLFTRR